MSDYRQRPIPANAIAQLLTAGFAHTTLPRFALFTGGGNGCGKSSFLHKALEPELLEKSYAPRNMAQFFDTVKQLHDSGQLFGAFSGTNGQQIWGQMTGIFPELKAIETYPVPMLNMDMIGYLLDECAQEKLANPATFKVSEHYYRALNAAPELSKAIAATGHSFVLDSTMSNKERIIESANEAHRAGHNVQFAVLHANPDIAIERALARAQIDGRHITKENLRASQRKMPANFWKFVQAAQANAGFIGLYDTSNGGYKTIAHAGTGPLFACQNPDNVSIPATNRFQLIAHNPEAYAAFRWGSTQRGARAL